MHILGLVPEAIAETEALARDEATTEHLLGRANLYLAKGDLDSYIRVARQLNRRPDLTSEQAIRLSSQVHYRDQELAIGLWRKANAQGLPDSLVVNALLLGYQFGLDDEVSPLLMRMQDFGGQANGGIQVKKIEEFVELRQQWFEHDTKSYELYQKGQIPIHLLAEHLKKTLVDFYHRFLENNEEASNLSKQIPLFIRHGGRPLIHGLQGDILKWRLHVDVTGILLAAHLDILHDVERIFKPLHIPQALVPALIDMHHKLLHQQPSRLQIYQKVVDAVTNGTVTVDKGGFPIEYSDRRLIDELGEEWVAVFERAKSNRGYLADLLPLQKIDLSGPSEAITDEDEQYLVSCMGIVEALWEEGPLSKKAYEDAVAWLERNGYNFTNTVIPRQGTHLYCHGVVAELLIGANVFDLVCEHFQVHIEASTYERMYEELQENAQKLKRMEWLDNLIDRIRNGIEDETYQMLPLPCEKELLESIQNEPPERGCLIGLMGADLQENDVFWVDDRWATGYAHWYGAQIIGINEILKTLFNIGALKEDEYYAKVSQLRKANVRFIPPEADEIIVPVQS